MALWAVDIEKVLQNEYWTNRYIVEATELGDAVGIADDIVQIERAVHNTNVLFTKARVADRVPLTDVYASVPYNVFGLQTLNGHFLPLFNVARVDFNVQGGGRPSRKYLRLPIQEEWQQDGVFIGAFQTLVANSYVAPMVALVGYVDTDGQEIIDGSLYPSVGMRQLRRGSKRREEPIL